MPKVVDRKFRGRRNKPYATDTPALQTRIVPWRGDTLSTDSYRLPALTGGIYRSAHTYVQTNWLSQSASVPVTASMSWSAAVMITDFASWAATFDQYRCIGIEMYLDPFLNTTSTAATLNGRLYTVVDYDDTSALSTPAAALAYDTCITTATWQRQRRAFKPRIAQAAYGSGVFTSFANLPAPWIDCASGTVAHYGVKAILDIGAGAGNLQNYSLTVRAIVEFRAAR
jgi:hypothetical protein